MAAATDVFGRKPSPLEGAFSADSSTVTVGGIEGAKALIQNLQISYQQQVNQIYEVGSANRYYVVGRTNGTIAIGRVVGPANLNDAILTRLGNACAAGNKSLTFNLGSASCLGVGKGASVEVTADACVATSVSYSVQAQDMLVNENVQAMFGQLSKTPGRAPARVGPPLPAPPAPV
jgi:hypothetical protein